MHGTFSRADTWNFMAARGPNFRDHYIDALPTSNADIAMTVAHLFHLDSELKPNGSLQGRVLAEALVEGNTLGAQSLFVTHRVIPSKAGAGGAITLLKIQQVGQTRYLDVAGFPGRSVGLESRNVN